MKRYVALAGALLFTALIVAGCTEDNTQTATSKEQQQQATGLAAMLKSQPVPKFDWSQIRQTQIDAETAQANTTQTTTFFFVQGVQSPVFACPSIGFPVPGDSQLSNPQQLVTGDYLGSGQGYAYGTVGQIEPNGIYSGQTAATFVLCVGSGGKVYMHHAEEIVHAVAGPAVWDLKTHQIQITGAPTFKVKVGK